MDDFRQNQRTFNELNVCGGLVRKRQFLSLMFLTGTVVYKTRGGTDLESGSGSSFSHF